MVIATPGCLCDYIDRRLIDLSRAATREAIVTFAKSHLSKKSPHRPRSYHQLLALVALLEPVAASNPMVTRSIAQSKI